MDKDALDLREKMAVAFAQGRGYINVPMTARRDAEVALAALEANGYVVLPRDLLDKLAAAYNDDKRRTFYGMELRASVRAVVEAVGPTREDTKA